MDISRREWLRTVCGTAAIAGGLPEWAGAVAAQPAGEPAYDLIIAGGRLIDPLQGVSGQRDVAVLDGKVARVDQHIPLDQARRVVDARGKLVTPGLIDIHGHVYHRVLPISIEADRAGVRQGVTTIVDAGSAGASTFAGLREYVIRPAETRVYALLNIATIGLVVTNEVYLDPAIVNPQAAIRVIEENRDLILGIKVRINGLPQEVAHDRVVLEKAREVSDATGLPLMLHWTHEPELLELLKAGDILTHPFNPPPHGQMLDEEGRILPQIAALSHRGIFTDFAHGTHLKWETAEAAAMQDWFPDAISTDIHAAHAAPGGVVIDLLTTMSKFMQLGLSVDEVVKRVTANPTRMLRFPDRIGTLRPGAAADVTILELREGDIELRDSLRQVRMGHQRLSLVATLRAGRSITPA
jgi:dihydroorotase